MYRQILNLSIVLLLACIPAASSIAASDAPDGRYGKYIVVLEDPSLAAWRGGETRTGLRLKATSPAATGAGRLKGEDGAVKAYRAYLNERRRDTLNRAESTLGRALEPNRVYEAVLNGVVLELSGSEAARLAGLPGVESVTREFRRRLETDAGPEWIGAEPAWEGSAAAGVAGTKGEGVIVGIIDSGINPEHPSFADVGNDGYDHQNPRDGFLGLCVSGGGACNDKLIGIYDFVEDSSDGRDDDGHGSHVASTAAGNHVSARLKGRTLIKNVPISGVAPHANIVSYKACQPVEDENATECAGSALIDALEQAVTDGVDVVNYSVGSLVNRTGPWQHAESRAMRDARASGVVVVASAGNGGPADESISLPAVAPWVVAVGNSTHDRRFLNRLTDMQGGNSPAPMTMTGVGFTGGVGPERIVHAREFGHPLCGEGPMDFPPTGASNPFDPGTFDGQIVVCDRGKYARVEKGFNVMKAGANGYVLANTEAFGESIVSDDHHLPAVHIGLSDANVLRQWLDAGGERRARITGAIRSLNPAFADIVAASSSRGPGKLAPHVLKPDLVAPGTAVLAADRAEGGTTNRYQFLSGTSMSSPHVAGAAALLRAARPAWSTAEIHSALVGTAVADPVTDSAGGGAAGARERGAGRLDIGAAVDAGLLLDESIGDFENADPGSGGRPQDLNLPALANHDCLLQCLWERTLKAARAGIDWRAEVSAPEGVNIKVEPATFTTGARGSEQRVSIQANVSNADIGEWVNGEVRFVAVGGAGNLPSDLVLPLNVFVSGGDVPERLKFDVNARGGSEFVELDGLVALPDFSLEPTGLTRGVEESLNLREDDTRNDPYDNFNDGTTFFKTVSVDADDPLLVAEVIESNAKDIDLFVGRDTNGDGEPGIREEQCASTTPDVIERCELKNPEPGEYWILVQNWDSTGAANSLRLVSAVVPAAGDNLIATAPSRLDIREAFDLRVAWDESAMRADSRWYGGIAMGTEPSKPDNLGLVPVLFKRGSDAGLARQALVPGREERFQLPGDAGHPGLSLDLPPDVTRVIVTARTDANADVDLFAARGRVPEGNNPEELAADADVRGRDRVNSTALVINDGNGIEPGRWFIVPFNDSSLQLDFTLSVAVETEGDTIAFRRGMWFNPDRSGHGLDLNRAAGRMSALWFTYLEDGTPAWYLADAPYEGNVWTADLLRFTWDGNRSRSSRVGEIAITFNSPESATLSWRLYGRSGSEPLQPCEGHGSCIPGGLETPVDRTGTWFPPAEPGWGETFMTKGDILLHVFYLYDGNGNPRWVLGNSEAGDPEGATTDLLAFEGFCPVCERVEPTTTGAGSVTINSFDGRTRGNIDVDVSLPDPYPGTWQREGIDMEMLSAPVEQ